MNHIIEPYIFILTIINMAEDIEFGYDRDYGGNQGYIGPERLGGGYIEGADRLINRSAMDRINRSLYTPEETFLVNLNTAFESLSTFITIDINLKRTITQFALTRLPHVAYKNPVAVILGCLASENHSGSNIDQDELNRMVKIASNFKDTINITIMDVIRYARFAINKGFEAP